MYWECSSNVYFTLFVILLSWMMYSFHIFPFIYSICSGLYNRGYIYLDVPISDDSCISGKRRSLSNKMAGFKPTPKGCLRGTTLLKGFIWSIPFLRQPQTVRNGGWEHHWSEKDNGIITNPFGEMAGKTFRVQTHPRAFCFPVPPLEGFVMNRVQGDYFETLLYKIFVSIDEQTNVSEVHCSHLPPCSGWSFSRVCWSHNTSVCHFSWLMYWRLTWAWWRYVSCEVGNGKRFTWNVCYKMMPL